MKTIAAMLLCVGCTTARRLDAWEAAQTGRPVGYQLLETAASGAPPGAVEVVESAAQWEAFAPQYHLTTPLQFEQHRVAVVALGSTGTIRFVSEDGQTVTVGVEVTAQCGGAQAEPKSTAVLLPRSVKPVRVESRHVGSCERNDVP